MKQKEDIRHVVKKKSHKRGIKAIIIIWTTIESNKKLEEE